jgi:hypothetical protein
MKRNRGRCQEDQGKSQWWSRAVRGGAISLHDVSVSPVLCSIFQENQSAMCSARHAQCGGSYIFLRWFGGVKMSLKLHTNQQLQCRSYLSIITSSH